MSTDNEPSLETVQFMQKVLIGIAVIILAFVLGLTFRGCDEAHAQSAGANKGGYATYAIQNKNWPCKTMMNAFQGVPTLRLSVLFNTFGTSFDCLNTWASDPRPKYLQTHIINEVCQRNRQCGKYEFLAGLTVDQYRAKLAAKEAKLLTRMRDYAAPMARWYHEHPDVACNLSGGLESNLRQSEYQVVVDTLRPLFPERCSWTWNPVNENRFGTQPKAGFVHELHGSSPTLSAPCIANFDGEDINLKSRPRSPAYDVTKLPRFLGSYASCDAAFFWIGEFNGRKPGAFIDPRQRTEWPNSKIFNELRGYLLQSVNNSNVVPAWTPNDEKAKAGCKTFIKNTDGAKKDFLWKQSEPPCCGRGAVTFLPRAYNNTKFNLNDIYVMKGDKKVATAYERGVYTEDRSNRQFWRFRKTAEEFPFNVVAHYKDVCVVLTNPRIRND